MQRLQVEAQQIIHYLSVGEVDDFFVEQAVRFVYVFLEIPATAPEYASVLSTIAELANVLHVYIGAQGRWNDILYLWTALAAQAKRFADWEKFASLTIRAALVANHYRSPQDAVQLYLEIINLNAYESLPALKRVEVLHQFSVCLIDLGDYATATTYLQNAIALCEQNQEYAVMPVPVSHYGARIDIKGTFWEHHGFLLNLLGNIALMSGRYEEAQRHYAQSAHVFEKHDVNEDFAYSANQSLGRLWLYRQEYTKALPYLLRNYELNHRHSKVQGNATSSCYLAAVYIGLHRLNEAETLLNSAISIFNQLQDAADIAMCHLYFGELESARGHNAAAMAQWQRVPALLQCSQSYMIEQQALAHLMLHHLRAGEIADSLAALARLLKCLKHQHVQPYSACAAVGHSLSTHPTVIFPKTTQNTPNVTKRSALADRN